MLSQSDIIMADVTAPGPQSEPGASPDRTPDITDVRAAPDVDPGDVAWLDDLVDEWGRQSFPASDPPANW